MGSRMLGVLLPPLLLGSCHMLGTDLGMERARIAETFFRGVYGGEPAVVDELASADVVVSYPVFREIFGSTELRGRPAIQRFATRFHEKWTEPRIRIDDSVADRNRVVLVWSFEARDAGSGQVHAWGGISLFCFDEDGRITAEIGEESDPGPFGRLTEPPR